MQDTHVHLLRGDPARLGELSGWLTDAGFAVDAGMGLTEALAASTDRPSVLVVTEGSEWSLGDASWLAARSGAGQSSVVAVAPGTGAAGTVTLVEQAAMILRLRERLGASTESLTALIHASSQPLAVVSPGLRFLDWNTSWAVQVSGAEWHGDRTLLEHTVEEDRAALLLGAERALDLGKPICLERRAIRDDGTVFATDTTLSPLGRNHPDLLVEVVDVGPSQERTLELQHLVRAIPVPAIVMSRNGQCVSVNEAMAEFVGLDRGHLVGRFFRDLLEPGERRRWEAVRSSDQPVHANLSFVKADGTRVPGLVNASPLGGGGLTADQSLVVISMGVRPDSTSAEHIARSTALVSIVKRLQRHDVEAVLDDVLAVVASMVHASAAHLTQEEPAGVPPFPPEASGEASGSDDDLPTRHPVLKIPLAGCDAPSHLTVRRTFDTPFSAPELRFLSEVAEMIGKAIVRERQERAQLREATHDALTGLPNADFLRQVLTERLGDVDSRGRPHALILIDLDHFHEVNDGLSFETGDELLRLVADRLGEGLVDGDLLARVGGDEFAVLISDQESNDDVEALAEALATRIASPFELGGASLQLTASLGMAMSVTCAGEVTTAEADQVVKHARFAVERAKRSGGARCEVYDGDVAVMPRSKIELFGDLQRGMAAGEIEAWFQPVVDVFTGHVLGMEALARWRHPERGVLLPADFITLAEETGSISELGLDILSQACRQVAEWRKVLEHGSALSLSVNVSPRQLASYGFADSVMSRLVDSGLASDALTLEITESLLVADPAAALHVLEQIAALGVRISIDDFGTGYSSLTYLRQFPVHELKIDQRFVSGLGVGGAPEIAAAVVGLAHSMGLTAVAEGVETSDQMAALRQLGCRQAQGFLWAPAMPADDFAAWWAGLPADGLAHCEAVLAETAVVPEPAGTRQRPAVDSAVLAAVRSMLRSTGPASTVSALERLVRELGGYSVPARLAGDRGLPFDLSLGTSEPVVPIAEPDSVCEALLREVVPAALDDAALTIEHSRLVARLGSDATVDQLTGLLNRRGLARVMRRLRPGDVVCLIDLDHFKEVNDSFGHARGDDVLRAFGRLLREESRTADYVGRQGGDEFVAINLQSEAPEMVEMLARLRERWQTYRPLPVSFTAGVATVGATGDGDDALGRADEALYDAKRRSRDSTGVAPESGTPDQTTPHRGPTELPSGPPSGTPAAAPR